MKEQDTVVTFKKTNEKFGGFSNMSGDFPILVNGVRVRSTEHLYQALKFSDHPDVQRVILEEPSPMRAKWIAKSKDDAKKNKEGNLKKVRKDWNEIQVEAMDFCLRTKLIWHWVSFGKLIESTDGQEIFEIEAREVKLPFWGVVPDGDGFRGENTLGKLLMKLRDELFDSDNESLMVVTPPPHLGLMFLCEEIVTIDRRNHLLKGGTRFSERVAEVRP
jgi:predicted NAD-dependent protein-ADP-ribosyltransferase YbiA (DUF1768 family)